MTQPSLRVTFTIMDQERLKKYKNKLESERKLLLDEIRRNEKPTDFGDDIDSSDEEADETEELGNQLSVAQNLKTRLTEIDIAIEKIGNGTYGTCEKCHEPIEEEILDIDPESRFNKKCKTGQ